MDISEILSSLTSDDIEKLKGAAESILGGQKDDSQKTEKSDKSGIDLSPSIIDNIGKLSKVVSGDDDRTALIKALRPMLSETRQQKADEAIKILKLIQLIPLLKDSGLLKDLL